MATASAPWPELPALAHAVAVGELDGDEAIAAIVEAIVARELAQASRRGEGPPTDVVALRRTAETAVRNDRVLMAMLRPLAPSAPSAGRGSAKVVVGTPPVPAASRTRSKPSLADQLEPPPPRLPDDLGREFPADDFAARQRMRRIVAGAAIVLGGVVGIGVWAMFLREGPCERFARQVCLELSGQCGIGRVEEVLREHAIDDARCDGVREAGAKATTGIDPARRGKVYETAIMDALGFDPRTGAAPAVEAAPEQKKAEPLVIATGVAGPTSFAVDDAYAYFTSSTPGLVGRVRSVGSTIDVLAQGIAPSGITPTQDFVYWRDQAADGTGALWIDRKRGTYEPQVLGVGASKVGAADCMQGECAFVDTLDGSITAVAQDNTPPRKLTAAQQPAPHEVRLAGPDVIWALPGGPAAIATVPLAGGPVRLLAGNESQPRHLRADAEHVYWIAEPGLRRVPRAGGDVETVVSPAPASFVLDGTRIVLTDAASGSIAALAKQGGAVEVLASGQAGVSWVAVDAAAIYWTAGDSIVRLPK